MRFMIIVKATRDTEAGMMPSEKLLADMGRYNEELVKAGVMLDGAGLKPSSTGARIKYASSGKTTVVDGPFSETKELIAGYSLIEAKSKEEAIAWAQRMPNPAGEGKEAEIEVRQLYELEDFEPSAAIDRYRDTGFALGKK
jgi:hypothetical protein